MHTIWTWVIFCGGENNNNFTFLLTAAVYLEKTQELGSYQKNPQPTRKSATNINLMNRNDKKMLLKGDVTYCKVISGENCRAGTPQRHPLTAKDVIKINMSGIWRITTVTPHKYPCYSKIKMSACLLLTAGSGSCYLQDSPEWTRTN